MLTRDKPAPLQVQASHWNITGTMSRVTSTGVLRAWLLTTTLVASAHGAVEPALAHGSVHSQIEQLSGEIARDPRNAELHLRRGRAYLAADHAAEAAADLRRALRLDPALHGAHYFLGVAELARGRAKAARRAAERFLRTLGQSDGGGRFRGLTLLARALAESEQHAAAADAYGQALAFAEHAQPEDYLVHAELLERAGRRAEALATVQAGLVRLGSIITLEQRALALEVAAGQLEAALSRLARLIEHTAQPAALWQQRGRLLAQLGRMDEAKQCYATGLAILARLSAHKRDAPALRELRAQLEADAAR
jgi:tetratricopeptide (TPR) repeat protein